jgi:hypothetical protein
MPIDDRLGALEKQFQMEDLSASTGGKVALELASLAPLPWPFSKIIERLKARLVAEETERIRLMLTVCVSEVRKHETDLNRMPAPEEFVELLSDAARKAEATRAKERVKRIALILANAMVESKPTDADEIEEMMRVAMDVSDTDLKYLAELIRIEAAQLAAQDHIARFDAHMIWEKGFWGTRIVPEIDSVFSKLESYGLVARIPPPSNLTISADFQNRYVLLKKGLRFAELIRETAERSQ